MTQHINILHDARNQCASIRFEAPLSYNLPKLDGLDIHVHLNPKHSEETDTLVFQRPSSNETFEMVKEAYSRWNMPVLLEFDDAIWDPKVFEGAGRQTKKQALRMQPGLREVIKDHCDGIVVSTQHIADKLTEITKKPILIMPNAVNPNYAPTTHSKTILYAGAGNRTKDFSKEWIDAIKDMKKQGYKFISTTNLGIEDERLETIQFGDYYNRLRYYAPEYYIAPLADTELNRGRSNLKEIEAASINAKFLGGIGVEPDFSKAKIPELSEDQNYTSPAYLADFLTAYSGLWLMGDNMAKEWKKGTKLMG